MADFLNMIDPLVRVLHLLVAGVLIVSVLLQAGRGTGLGAAFGVGASQTLFGAQGSGNFLSRVTVVSAFIFLLTSLSLALVAKTESLNQSGPSVIDEAVAPRAPTPEAAPKP